MPRYNWILSLTWITTLSIAIIFHAIGGLWNIHSFSIYLVLSAATLVMLNWHTTAGGRNPSFLFLSFALIFMLGRAIPSVFGGDSQLLRIQFGSEFSARPDTVIVYGILTLASLFSIHIGSSIAKQEYKDSKNIDATLDAKIYLSIFIAFLPLYLYKNYYYFSYIMESGGYMAIYQDSEHITGVGLLPRISSLICLSSFTLYFFHESDKKTV